MRLLLAISLFLIAASSTCLAQEKEPVDVIRVNTDLVVFDVEVIDKKTKRIVGNLKQGDFEIVEDGVRQQLGYLSRDELPLSIMLLLDVSGSVRSILHDIRDGALNALGRLKPEDEVALMPFAAKSELVQDFTRDRKLMAQRIIDATVTERLGSATFLDQALDKAVGHMPHASNPTSRRVIIIVTDNIVGIGWRPLKKDVLAELFETGTVVYGLIVKAAVSKVMDVMFLGQSRGVNDYVKETGGEMLGADRKEVESRLAEMIDRLRARYTLGYRPSNTTEDGNFRRVEINISPDKKRKEKPVVLTKKGYYLRRKPYSVPRGRVDQTQRAG
jgi:VWFA-related protein